MLNVIGSAAQFEREMMLERQREGIARPRATAGTRAGSLPPEQRRPTFTARPARASRAKPSPNSSTLASPLSTVFSGRR